LNKKIYKSGLTLEIKYVILLKVIYSIIAEYKEYGGRSMNRFEIIYKEQLNMDWIKILVDKKTGVQYIRIAEGITVLVDKDGKPLLAEGY
jgi:hypothetical protein